MANQIEDTNYKLIESASFGKIDLIKEALEKGADINYVCSNQTDLSYTALHISSFYGLLPTVEFLLQNPEIDLTITGSIYDESDVDVFYGNALHMASAKGHVEVAKALIEKGLNVNEIDGTLDYFTPLHTATKFGQIEIIKLLLDKGADVNAPNGAEDTSITIASESGYLEIIKYLVSKGATVIVESNVQTPLLAAAENGHLEVVEYLVKEGYDINGGAKYRKDTALQMAAQNNHLDIVRFLLDKGADVELLNSEGKSLLEIASPQAKEMIQKKN